LSTPAPSGLRARIESLGESFITLLEQAGAFLLLFFAIVRRLPILFARPRLVAAQVHFLGNYSLAIILVSGLFVGLVLGLQGYYTLRRYGSEEALGSVGRPLACAGAWASRNRPAFRWPSWHSAYRRNRAYEGR
jgi:ABC-type transport system involved in resistance to organic solvents, permease component